MVKNIGEKWSGRMHSVLEQIRRIGIVPVVKIDRPEDALPLANALCEGGLPVAEITFRTAHAKQAMEIIRDQCPQMLVGAGTVLTTAQVDDAVEAGAKFIVSPGLNPEVVRYCLQKGVPIVPGCANASDIECALSLGLDTVKFFPAEPLGGLKMLKALAGPYVNVKFMPTGGINADNICSYLAWEKIVACGGTWMIDSKAVAAGDFETIKALTRKAVQNMLGLTLAHVGIHTPAQQAGPVAEAFAGLLGTEEREGKSSIFAGNTIEVMKGFSRPSAGHIAYSVNNLDRAVRYFEARGYAFDAQSLKKDEKGNPVAIYFQEDIGGFSVHLVQKK